MSYSHFFIALAFLASIYLITRTWFWCLTFFLLAISSFFAMLASIVHFQILGALGFFILGSILWVIFQWIVAAKYDA